MGEKHDGTIDACIMDIGKADWYTNKLLKYLNDLKKINHFLVSLTMLPNYLRKTNNEEWKWT